MAKATYFGIDLGTTYSAISFINDMGQAEIIDNLDGSQLTPSIVYFGDNGIIVGEKAKDRGRESGDEAQRVVSFVKRSMPPAEKGQQEYELDGEKYTKIWEFDGRKYTPVDISAEIIKKLKSDAVQLTQVDIQKVVVTCPAFFESIARNRTRQAAMKGLGLREEDVEILDEPTAAALNYALVTGEDIKGKTFLVYDLGGGTFDITVLTVKGDPNDSNKTEYQVVCTFGNHYLGGGNWDDRIVEFFKAEFQNQTGIAISQNTADDEDEFYELEFNLRQDAEKRKQELSDANCNSCTQKIKFRAYQDLLWTLCILYPACLK